MQYVSSTSSYRFSPIFLGLVCFFANSLATLAETTELSSYLLTDQEISSRCATSIRLKHDMVDSSFENGMARKVPRCVSTYEGMRSVAHRFHEGELRAIETMKQSKLPMAACSGERATQDGCARAGEALNRAAAEAHQNVVTAAEEGERELSSLRDGK